MHNCAECGIEHEAPEPEVVVEEVVDTEPIAEANVEIARIEADRDIKVAKIERGVAEDEMANRLAELEGQLTGVREVLDRLMAPPEPEPAPVVIEEPAPVEEEMPPREERHEPKAPASKRGFFS